MREELRGVSSFVAWDVDRAQDPAVSTTVCTRSCLIMNQSTGSIIFSDSVSQALSCSCYYCKMKSIARATYSLALKRLVLCHIWQ